MRMGQSGTAAKYFKPKNPLYLSAYRSNETHCISRGRLTPFLANTTPPPARGNRSAAITHKPPIRQSQRRYLPPIPSTRPPLLTSPLHGTTFRNDDNHHYKGTLDRIYSLSESAYRSAEENLRLHRHPIPRNPCSCNSRLPREYLERQGAQSRAE
jgi:hypothetical protein